MTAVERSRERSPVGSDLQKQPIAFIKDLATRDLLEVPKELLILLVSYARRMSPLSIKF